MLLPLFALLLASPSLSSPLPTQSGGVSTSKGFRLLTVPQDASKPLGTLVALHTGAGQNRAGITHDLAGARPMVFYQNATAAEGVIVHDVLPQGYPLRILIDAAPFQSASSEAQSETAGGGDEDEGLRAVHLTVSATVSNLLVNSDPLPSISYKEGSFWACEESDTPSLPGTWTLLNWSPSPECFHGGEVSGAEGCQEVRLVPVCDELEDLPEGALVNHDSVVEVGCFVDEDVVKASFGR